MPSLQSRLVAGLRGFQQKHDRLKKSIHEGFRYPLPKWGQKAMGFVYFTIPVVGGWYVMQWAISKSHASIGEYGEKLPVKEIQGIGDKRLGAGGDFKTITTGVKLAVSDEETQRKNRNKLDRFLKRQKRIQERRKQELDSS